MANAIDPTLFSGEPIREVTEFTPAGAEVGAVVPQRTVPMESLLQGSALDQLGDGIRRAADRERATRIESIGAALMSSDGARLIESMTKPGFEPDAGGFDLKEAIGNTAIAMTEDELDYMRGTRSAAEYAYKVARIKELRDAQQAQGDNPFTSMIGGVIGDPMTLAGVGLTGGAGMLMRGASTGMRGRVLAGTLNAAGAGVGAALGEGPVSTHDVVANMLLNGAAGAWAFKPGVGRVKVDPDFPQDELADIARQTATQASPIADPFVGPVGRRMVSPERVIDEVVTGKPVEFAGKDGRKYTLELDSDYNITARFGDEIVGELESAPLGYTFGDGTPSQAAWMGVEPAHARNGVNTAMNDFAEAKVPGYSRKSNLFTEDGAAWFAGSQGKPRTRFTEQTLRRTEEAVYEDYPAPLRPGAHLTASPDSIVRAVDQELSKAPGGVWEKLQWNIRKSMASFGETGRKIADLLFDNNSDLGTHSMESHRWSIRQELTGLQRQWEDTLRESMATEGAGILKRITSPRQAAAKQAEIEQQVQREMFRREQFNRQGLPTHDPSVPKHITQMADQLDAVHALALKELKAAGVEGAEDLVAKAGWHHRRWSSTKIDDAIEKFKQSGLTEDAARMKIGDMVGLSIRRASPRMDMETARDIGHVIINRALRKGYFEDNIMSGGHSAGELAQIRDMLKSEGVTGARAERIMDALRTSTDEQGKAGFMKHRMDLDYKASTFVNGQQISVMDLIDTQMTRNVDQYLDQVSTQAAMARKGIRSQSQLDDLRNELAHSLPEGKRGEAVKLFDQIMDHFYGRPSGQEMNKHMRNMGVYGRMIALANSGLWQTTEYATMMAKYGMLKTAKYALKEMPLIRTVLKDAKANPGVGRQLHDLLTQHSEQNVRIRPFTNRFEDGFEYGAGDTATLLGQTGGQLVPYVNAMKYIHTHQARMASNLVIDRLSMASKGNAKALAALEKYGLGSQVMDKLKAQINAHGHNVDAWDDGVWAAVRPAFGKMMDEAVLHARLGDMPAFAMFDNVGKFLFTYRSFMLTAHNKILAGGLARDGMGPTALIMAYQFPLAAMAVQAQSLMQGKGVLSEQEMAAKAMGQMGGLGFGAEIAGVASGQKGVFGSPGLIPVDRAYKLVGSALQGKFEQTAGTAAQMIPIISLTPARNLGKLLED